MRAVGRHRLVLLAVVAGWTDRRCGLGEPHLGWLVAGEIDGQTMDFRAPVPPTARRVGPGRLRAPTEDGAGQEAGRGRDVSDVIPDQRLRPHFGCRIRSGSPLSGSGHQRRVLKKSRVASKWPARLSSPATRSFEKNR